MLTIRNSVPGNLAELLVVYCGVFENLFKFVDPFRAVDLGLCRLRDLLVLFLLVEHRAYVQLVLHQIVLTIGRGWIEQGIGVSWCRSLLDKKKTKEISSYSQLRDEA